ncbi:hypothetical protein L5876_08410 [Hyphobacterium sp. SN044]|uniref:hypothetical protein n=1 Tax=Hyphobacterium sp. SN044 TaxID=2912575 RepID=UPI001F3AD2C6|nr:hypothetical protein [Hyphobacterium sp. SN044]MCF8879832.1 hypothetical protein [Hyphobacterium sp. SN044]
MILALFAAITLLADDAQMPDPDNLLPDGRYVEDLPGGGDACADASRRHFELAPGTADDPEDRGRFRADFGDGAPIDMELAMSSMHPRELAGGEVQGVGVIQGRGPSGERLAMTLLMTRDGRYSVAQVQIMAAGQDPITPVRMEEDPLPHGIASDGTALEPFVACGTE